MLGLGIGFQSMFLGDVGQVMASTTMLLAMLGSFVGTWLYFALMEAGPMQGTLGKKVCGLIVTDLEGNRLSFLRATGRYFAKILSSMILGIGFLMAGFTARKQGLHDMAAGTLVYKARDAQMVRSDEDVFA